MSEDKQIRHNIYIVHIFIIMLRYDYGMVFSVIYYTDVNCLQTCYHVIYAYGS